MCCGVVVLVVATLVALGHNAVRGHSLPVLQRRPVPAQVAAAKSANDRGTAVPAPGQRKATPDATAKAGEGTVDAVRNTGTAGWTAAGVKSAIETGSIVVIDARSAQAYAEGHIPGAHNIPYDQLPDYYDHLIEIAPTDARVVCYCWSESCDFSDQLSTELRIAGSTDVHVFRGGWADWEAAGYRIEAGDRDGPGEGGR